MSKPDSYATYRPFDNRWLYWEADSEAARSPSVPTIKPHVFEGNLWLVAREREAKARILTRLLISSS